ncbi:succinate dehydrogenase, cytochrome b556 subunit [Zhengella mangrovi]|uniref:Succinate dehydrogenase cytochrome b556 subunit n=1 Tax=Zhengella mangrovi TaxID=1982044 RepID=A0A2G1QSK9_9HYPH|nr:succinate dehydrogenase, cytochrome b556 subunit [Zhengella mangrovi]PHP68527.1 succinate dehydrogenase, cytochrome b556 subunit [Zhengella mangrovi]
MSKDAKTRARPISPHLQIYKPIPTMVMSITHRITGGALYFGMLLVAWWLIAAASGPDYFDWVNGIYGSFLGRLILFGFTFALIHHLLGGIKHLFWDMGHGFDKDFATRVARMQPIASAVLTLAVWIIGYMAR